MNIPACRSAVRPASWPVRNTLAWLAAEPFRVFFFTGTLFSIAGVVLWPLFYAGWLSYHPAVVHARIMVQAFGGAFVLGFLGTAGPRMLAAPRLTPAELAGLFALHLGSGCCHLGTRTDWGDALFLALFGGFVACLGGRMLFLRRDRPPPAMLLAAIGVLCGMAGTAMWLMPSWHDTAATYRLAGLLLYQGFLLAPIMGVGCFLFPRMLGADFGETEPGPQTGKAWWCTLLAASALLASFAVEAWLSPKTGMLLRASAFTLSLSGVRWKRPVGGPPIGTLANALRGCCLPLALIGIASPALDEARRVSLEHFLFIGGYGLLCLVVGSRVLFGHSGELSGFGRKSRLARILVSLTVIAVFTRVSAEFWPRILISHHVYAASLWAAVALLWLFWHARRFLKKDPEPV